MNVISGADDDAVLTTRRRVRSTLHSIAAWWLATALQHNSLTDERSILFQFTSPGAGQDSRAEATADCSQSVSCRTRVGPAEVAKTRGD